MGDIRLGTVYRKFIFYLHSGCSALILLVAFSLLAGCNSGSDNTDTNIGSQSNDILQDPESIPELVLDSSNTVVTTDGLQAVELSDGRRFYQGDILIPDRPPTTCDSDTETSPGSGLSTSVSCLNTVGGLSGNLWPGSMPLDIDPTLPPAILEMISDARTLIESQSGLLLPDWSGEENYVDIGISDPGDPSFSQGIGMQGGRQLVRYTENAPFGTILHELLHAAGVFHEHARSDRSPDFVTVALENVVANRRNNFEVDPGSFPRGDYDFNSVMHYSSRAFSLCGGGLVPDQNAGCPVGSETTLCPDGSSPDSNGRCTTIFVNRSVPVVVLTCVPGKYGCDSDGSVSSARFGMGQRVGLSPIDIEQIRQVYKDTLLSIDYQLVPFLDPGKFTLSLDGQVLTRLGDGGNNFTLGAFQLTVGDHQLTVEGASATDLADYSIAFGGDCDANGNFNIERKEKKICALTISAFSNTAGCLAQCDADSDLCFQGDFQLPRQCVQIASQCRASCQ